MLPHFGIQTGKQSDLDRIRRKLLEGVTIEYGSQPVLDLFDSVPKFLMRPGAEIRSTISLRGMLRFGRCFVSLELVEFPYEMDAMPLKAAVSLLKERGLSPAMAQDCAAFKDLFPLEALPPFQLLGSYGCSVVNGELHIHLLDVVPCLYGSLALIGGKGVSEALFKLDTDAIHGQLEVSLAGTFVLAVRSFNKLS